ncbi:MAG: Hint domain-containing protein [Paracoccaceae bacterium]|nr:Hint domain-containing protein [Paracoccaceae bacterium]
MEPKAVQRVGGTFRQTDQILKSDTSGAGLVSGTRIPTLDRDVPVEQLCVGSHVLTRDFGPVRVIDIETISLITPVVYIIAGSIGHTRQDRDVMLTGDQTIMVRDWRAQALFGQANALTHASALIDGEFVRDLGQQAVTVYRIHCTSPQLIFADGLELGTANNQFTEVCQRAA